jgi:hypothetical protein
MSIKIIVFWVVMPCSLVYIYQATLHNILEDSNLYNLNAEKIKKGGTLVQEYEKLLPFVVHICKLLQEMSRNGKSKDITFSM